MIIKKILKWVAIIIVALFVIGFIAIKAFSEKMPEGKTGPEVEVLTQNIFKALNKDAWDSLKMVQWNFAGRHKFLWDKEKNITLIEWDKYKVVMDLDRQEGSASEAGQVLSGDKKQEVLDKAWAHWCNDSFWFFAPFKLKDPGTKRSIVENEDGTKGLMVTYESGGVTPGDSYMWVLNEDYIPTGYKMWVSTVPVKGLFVSWEKWIDLEGVKVATEHKSGRMAFSIEDIMSGVSYEDFGYDTDPFEL